MLESSTSVIRELFERRGRDFLLSTVRVTMRTSLENIEVGDFALNSVKEAETAEFPRWVAEELVELKLAEMQEEPFESEIFKAMTRERMLGSPQVSDLSADFYLKMRRRLEVIRAGVDLGKFRKDEYEKLRANCYDLIGRRLSKLLALSSSLSGLESIRDKLTPEERVFFTSTQTLSKEWKATLLGEGV